MVSVGIMGIIVLIASGASQMMMKSSSNIDKVSEQVALVNEISNLLNNPTTCTLALKGKLSSVENELALSVDLQSGQKYSNKIDIKSIQFRNITKVLDQVYRADVQVRGEKIGNILGSKEFSKYVRTFYLVNSENRIVSCLGENVDIVANCTALGGIWSEISSKCDFCATLGGEWRDGKCNLPKLSELANSSAACEPELFSQEAHSVPATGKIDECTTWSTPIFNTTLTYINNSLGRRHRLQPADVEAINVSYKDFYNVCITGEGLNTSTCTRSSSSGILNWSFAMLALPASGVGVGDTRCAVKIIITNKVCM